MPWRSALAEAAGACTRGVGEPEPAHALSIMLTRRCNMTCAHCSVQSGPSIRTEPSDAELIALLHAAADAGIRSIQLTGGEPMIREKLVLEMLRAAQKRGLMSTMSSNGFWGRTHAGAWSRVAALRRAGLGRITISYDRYHAEFQGPGPALNIARAAEWFGLPCNLNITRVANDPEIAALVAPFGKRPQLRMRFYDVQVVGRARQLPVAEMRGEVSGFCNACSAPAITDDRRMTACNGPAYFLDEASPLVIGSTRDTPFPELLALHSDDVILETIRRMGPARLLAELNEAGETRRLGIRDQHAGICDLCIDINSNPRAVSVLRERLAAQRYQAELAATRIALRGATQDSAIGFHYANGPGASRLWMAAAAGELDRFDSASTRILGRADFDWNRSANYLAHCGVARALAPLLDRPALRRWAPSFFIDRMRRAGVSEGLHDLTQREVLRQLDDACASTGIPGVLLKGGALIAIETFDGSASGKLPRRASGDIDVYVERRSAARLRDALLSVGFRGSPTARRTGPHHLAPLSFNGVSLEIHTAIMPGFWGLPEDEMLSRARSVPGLEAIATLDAEGMLLHALTHSTAHLFSRGLRAAWDAAWLMERFPALDGERLAEWVSRLAMPRSFWVPARVLAQGLVSIPQGIIGHAPADDRQRRLERVAEARIYTAVEGAFDLNPISKNGFFLMLHDSMYGRARHVASLFGTEERESRRNAALSARERDHGSNRSVLALQLREGMMHWRQFQRTASQ